MLVVVVLLEVLLVVEVVVDVLEELIVDVVELPPGFLICQYPLSGPMVL